MYRAFLKAADNALPCKLHRHYYLRKRIRRGFEAFREELDPVKRMDWEQRAKNTLLLIQTASQRRGIEHDIIRNLAEAEFYQTKFDERPPFARHKLKSEVRELHNHADQEFLKVISSLNKELGLCL